MFQYHIQGKTVKDLTRHFMSFYSKILLNLQFLEVKITNQCIIYSQKLTNVIPCMTFDI